MMLAAFARHSLKRGAIPTAAAAAAAAAQSSMFLRTFADVPATMTAAVIRETGPSSVMKVETDYPTPKLAPGGVIIKNEYAGINFIDTYHRSGLYKRELPFIGGQEGGGTVVAVSPEAEQFCKVGDRVSYSSVFQTYCEYTAVPGAKVLPVPDDLDMAVAELDRVIRGRDRRGRVVRNGRHHVIGSGRSSYSAAPRPEVPLPREVALAEARERVRRVEHHVAPRPDAGGAPVPVQRDEGAGLLRPPVRSVHL